MRKGASKTTPAVGNPAPFVSGGVIVAGASAGSFGGGKEALLASTVADGCASWISDGSSLLFWKCLRRCGLSPLVPDPAVDSPSEFLVLDITLSETDICVVRFRRFLSIYNMYKRLVDSTGAYQMIPDAQGCSWLTKMLRAIW